jgi:hydantoinase/carbamoylase family amidase
MTLSETLTLGEAVLDRVTELARCSESPDHLTRRYLTPAYKDAAVKVKAWMEEAGMAAELDAAGNVAGRYEGEQPGARALLIGSHIDTVREAGWYDGNLGVIAAIACVGELARQGRRMPFAIEVIAFGDEEGSRFPTTFTGSRAIAGTFDPACLDAVDDDGVSVRDALVAFGGDPARAGNIGRSPEDVHAYVELHIEQGPVLEDQGLAVGTVTAINGASRFELRLSGMAGHAGTVPMALRQDALAGAALMISAIEEIGRGGDSLVATVGMIEALPGSINVVPGDVHFSLDVRAPDDGHRLAAVAAIKSRCREIADQRGLGLEIEQKHEASHSVCSPWVMDQLDAAVARHGIKPFRLPSGAGHDAMTFTELCPIGMLFMRCGGGISHNPEETVTTEDTDIATRVLLEFIERFEPQD